MNPALGHTYTGSQDSSRSGDTAQNPSRKEGPRGDDLPVTSPPTGRSMQPTAQHPESPATELRDRAKIFQKQLVCLPHRVKKSVPRGHLVSTPGKTLRKAPNLGLGQGATGEPQGQDCRPWWRVGAQIDGASMALAQGRPCGSQSEGRVGPRHTDESADTPAWGHKATTGIHLALTPV